MDKKELYSQYLKKNPTLKNTDIARAIIEDNKDQFKKKDIGNIRKRVSELREELGLPKPEEALQDTSKSLPQVVQEDRVIENLKKSKGSFESKYKYALSELEKVNKQLETVLNVKNSGIDTYEVPFKKKNKSQSTAVAVASDWHLGEVVEPDTVNSLNSFNLEIAKKRVLKFFQSIIVSTNIERQATEIDTLVLALLGDFIGGYIHPELVENADASPTETIIEVRNLIVSGIEFLKREGGFKKIVIPTAMGNHGRTTDKRRISTAYKNSYEWLLYKILEADYLNDSIVQFKVENGYHNWLKLYDKYDLRFHHGDNIYYNGGVGGITISTNKAIAQWNKIKPAYLDIFGHYHGLFDGGNFILNGSVIGFNAFALSIKASYEEPKQAFFLIDKDRGKTAVRPLFVTEK